MFYSPEILSQKNKTELSLVYYLSTTKNIKKSCRKEVVSVNFNAVLEKIKNPRVPFALRLYSYLLNGIVRMWMIKVEFYRLQAKNMFIPKRKQVISNRKVVESNVNLRIIENYITELEDCSNVNQDQIGSVEEIINDEITGNTQNDFFNNDFFNDNEIISFENTVKRAKKEVVDSKIQLEIEDIFLKKTKNTNFDLPSLVDCETSRKFEIFLNQILKRSDASVKCGMATAVQYQCFDNDFSVEDPRISSSISLEKNNFKPSSSENDEMLYKPLETRILSFYNILLAASKGEIEVFQSKPFDIIEIRSVTGIIYF